MTIAVCCLTPEGVVLGADSTASLAGPNGFHYLNYTQKLFELGEDSTLGVLTWGLGNLPGRQSYRTLFALLSDDLQANPAATVAEVMQRWIDRYWAEYSANVVIQRCQQLNAMANRNPAEEEEFKTLKRALVAGFCVGGYLGPGRESVAYNVVFDPLAPKPAGQQQLGVMQFWGAPNFFSRLMIGSDEDLKTAIIASGKWTGTPGELSDLCNKQALKVPILPIRDAIDLVHACISSTIKAMKFSDLPQICGGPVEIAVITSDRRFRWVRHKPWDAAILEG